LSSLFPRTSDEPNSGLYGGELQLSEGVIEAIVKKTILSPYEGTPLGRRESMRRMAN
jgi:hypothetical protein